MNTNKQDKTQKGGITVAVTEAEDGMTVRGVLKRSKGVSQRLIRKISNSDQDGGGSLCVNDVKGRFRDKVKVGDVIRLVFPEEASWIEPQDIPLDILFEDDDLLVINKQPGLVVHPTKGHRDGTLANGILWHMQKRGESYKPRFINRLDMGTSGILLVGKNSHAQDNLAKQGAADSVEKIYTAVLEGRLEDDLSKSGVIDLPIGLKEPGLPNRTIVPVAEGGYPSVTEYEVLPIQTKPELPQVSWVRIKLITGRTHQIRVHFAHFSHPVLGDSLYANPSPFISRQALHSTEISFCHPTDGRLLRFEAPLPDDIIALMDINERRT